MEDLTATSVVLDEVAPERLEAASQAAEEVTAFLPFTRTDHRGRVTFHVPQVREFVGILPSGAAQLGTVRWEGEPVRSRRGARSAAFMAWVDGLHLDAEEEGV